MKRGRFVRAVVLAAALGVVAAVLAVRRAVADAPSYSPAELRVLRSLSLASLGPLPDDPSNAWDTDPRAARLGRAIFFDARFSRTGTLACATCHPAGRSFQDDKPVAEGIGKLTRRSMPLIGVGYNTWFFWDGRRDSLWAQAATPLVTPLEHGLERGDVVAMVARHYRSDYEAIFGPLPDDAADPERVTRAFVNVAKSIAAFVRTIVPGPARFDRHVDAILAGAEPEGDARFTAAEARGLRLFIGRAGCVNCHAGPLFTNGEFHFTRVPQATPDAGRSAAIAEVEADELACTGRWSDAAPDACSALRFMERDTRESLRAFKTPTLRNVAVRAPYMHAGQLATLEDVLRFYRDNSRGLRELGHADLDEAALADLAAFLGTLTGPVRALADGKPAS